MFADRLEVWNPGALPPALTFEKLRHPHASFPGNPLLAEPLYLTKYIERMGTGIGDMIKRCRDAELREPEFREDGGCFVITIRRKTPQVVEQVDEKVTTPVGTKSGPSRDQVAILRKCMEESTIGDLMAIVDRSNRTKFRDQVLKPLLSAGLVEMTISDKPTSPRQMYRLTDKGHAWLKKAQQ